MSEVPNYLRLLHKRRDLIENNLEVISSIHKRGALKATCPACGLIVLEGRGTWDICPICWWEDDRQDDAEADEIWGGPNDNYSLTEYRMKFHDELLSIAQHEKFASEQEKEFSEAVSKMLSAEKDLFKGGSNLTEYLDRIKKVSALAKDHFLKFFQNSSY